MNPEDRLLKRFTVLKRLEYYIQESVYYRTYSEEIQGSIKKTLWTVGSDSGKISIYEDTNRG
jgi:hypothetical protein